MSDNWTKGPWVVETNNFGNTFVRVAHGGQVVSPINKANAHLIASAPDLYEALSEARAQIDYLHEKFKETGTGNSVLAKIDAALSKARGEQP